MTDKFQRAIAVRQLRLMLIKVGLTEGEADAFLEQLREDFTHANLESEDARLRFCEQQIRKIVTSRSGVSGRLEGVQESFKAIVQGLAAAALWELIKAEYGNVTAPQTSLALRDNFLRRWTVEWIGFPPPGYDWKVGERVLRLALEVVERNSGFQDERTAQMLTGLGRCLDGQQRYTEALPLLERAFGIERTLHGLEHPDTGISLINLGLHDYAQRRYAEAEPLLRRGLLSVEGGRGPDHIDTGGALYDLGTDLDAQRNHVEAEPLLRRALAIVENARSSLPVSARYAQLIQDRLRANLDAQARHPSSKHSPH